MAHGSASNFIRQTVGSSVGTNDPETIDVQDASAFPDPSTSQYDIVIWDAGSHNRPDQDSDVEVLTVTARDTTAETLTCDRGQQGTANTSHPDTSDVIVAPLSQLDVNTVDAQTVTTDERSISNIGGIYKDTTNDRTVSTGTVTKLQLDETDREDSTIVQLDAGNDNVVVQQSGLYMTFASITWTQSDGTGDLGTGTQFRTRIHQNGSKINPEEVMTTGANDIHKLSLVAIASASANDTFDVRAYHEKGSDATVSRNDFHIFQLG